MRNYYMELNFKEREALKLDVSKYFRANGIKIPKTGVLALCKKYNCSQIAVSNAASRIISGLY